MVIMLGSPWKQSNIESFFDHDLEIKERDDFWNDDLFSKNSGDAVSRSLQRALLESDYA
jgi:hypothetical protein